MMPDQALCGVVCWVLPPGEGADWRTVLYLLAEVQAPLLEGMEVATELEDEDALEELLDKEHALEEYAARCRSAQVTGVTWVTGLTAHCFDSFACV